MKNPIILSFITFSDYTDLKKVEKLFLSNHRKWHAKYEQWTMQSTSKRMEGDYWNFLVPIHFACIGIILFVIINWFPSFRPFWQTLIKKHRTTFFTILNSASRCWSPDQQHHYKFT